MKIVVLDGYTLNPGDLSWEDLKKLGDLTVYDRTPNDKIIERIGNAEIVFTNKVPITREVLEKTNIKYIGVLATGYDVVDINAAKEKGIPVTNIPTYGTASVAQMVFAHILEICHHVAAHSEAVKAGEWTNNPDWCFWKYPLIELADKNMGVIGYGRIGQAVGKIAQAFGMKVLAYDKYQNKDLESETMKYVDLDELLKNSDVISLHCPLTEENKGIINKSTIAKMKDSVIIINTARGQLIVEEDLAEALNQGKVYAAGLDVVSKEPIEEDNPLLKAKNIFITPHIAWAPKESRQRLMDIAVENLRAFLEGRPVNVVNK
ncbi:glycerate dehydrogenase [Tepidanaerobacter syntrophicus]|uniref:Glycerate dehydrogenase n=1 Tax=Tepidanaerobacter syntrophicus TaxID=224999 RepID=A0A0U9HC40_9FIRM|nr:D-2-hydroxyacid dehydrogenase [Tepidanaerobacter syntrophicus]GAQ24022.1 glycerate dehydrogenase [Tepidanaerobacter syntrophicus]GLI19473.1 glycerate dehydrogenase [Tepidanaerobacter syntrophicus]GLI51660.1 glycerate dehydrogenase [Tepidanaerobacter syntrophicus]